MPKKSSLRRVNQVIAITLGILGFLSLLGELGITNMGKDIYALLKYPLGEKAWIGPFLMFILAFTIWAVVALMGKNRGTNRRNVRLQENSRTKQNALHKVRTKQGNRNHAKIISSTDGDSLTLSHLDSKISLPKTKLVTLKGFNDYFSTPEGPQIENAEEFEELNDLGRDFATYFKEGSEISFTSLGTRLAPVRGFKDYFNEVSAELEEEFNPLKATDSKIIFPPKREWENPFQQDSYTKNFPGQVSQLVKLERKSPSGVSPEERAELLGNYRVALQEVAPQIDRPLEADSMQCKRQVVNWGEDLARDIELAITKAKDKEVDPESLRAVEATELNNLEEATEITKIMEESGSSDVKQSDSSVEIESPNYPEKDLKETPPELELVDKETLDSNIRTKNPSKPIAWNLPNLELLDELPKIPVTYDTETQKQLERVLGDFGVQAKVIRVARGPVITRYELAPAPGVKISRIVNLADDIALGLAARDVRIEAPIPGKAAIGIEVPNKQARSVPFREVLETHEFKEGLSKLRIALGKDIADQSVVADLAKMPHLLVAGATGSGKSVCITALINSILFNARPNEVKFLMVDPKMVELSIYNGIPHLLSPVVTDPKKAAAALKWVVKEMETRYELFAAAGVRDIERYNRLKEQESLAQSEIHQTPALPWIVVIIDELADLMMVAADEVEEAICRLAQMARAAGIHLVIATQRPSVDVITGVIKANIPSRISFAVSSQIDSRTILDATGAEKLLGRGDMLYSPQGLNKPLRVQGCMVTDDEVQRVISFWKAQGRPEYLDPEGFSAVVTSGKVENSGPNDELFAEAGRLVITTGMASVSFLQRKLKLGYARAARLMDLLEENGIVGGYEGSKPRQILLSIEEFEERFG